MKLLAQLLKKPQEQINTSYSQHNFVLCDDFKPNEPPNDNEPVSPIKILAGDIKYKKPKQAPIIAPQILRNFTRSSI